VLKEVYTLAELRNWSAATADVTPPLRLAAFGDPIAHSKSPQMHNPALAYCGINARYTRLHIKPDELAEALRLLPQAGFIGVNLTIPHKQAALSLIDEVDGHAQKIGAVNTIVVEGKKLTGFNTDGPGLVRAVRSEFGVDIRDLRVMVLGAGGGAGRAISVQCALEGCERLVLVNRTVEKAQSLAREIDSYFKGPHLIGPVARLEWISLDDPRIKIQLQNTDLVINATSMGMKLSDPSPLASSVLSPHLAADEVGARGVNGFSMLLHQGALAFEIWFNREAPLDVMRRGE